MSNKLVHGIIGLFGGLTSTIFGKEIIVFISIWNNVNKISIIIFNKHSI